MLNPIRRVSRRLFNFRHLAWISSAVFFLILGTALFVVYQNRGIMHEQINSDFNAQQLILAHQAASEIDADLKDIQVEIRILKKRLAEAPEGAWDEAMQAVVDRTRSKGLIEIGVVSAEGEILAREPLDGPPRPVSTEFLEDCRWDAAGHMVLGPLRMDEPSTLTSVLCSMMDSPEAEGNLLFARLDVSRLIANVTRPIRSGRTGYAWVIDENGIFLYHPDKEFIGQSAFEIRERRMPYVSFAQINRIMQEQMFRGEEGAGVYISGWHRGIEGKMTKLIAFTPVKTDALTPESIWSVAVVAPISEVAEPVRVVYTRHAVVEAALIASMFAFGLLVAVYQNRMSDALKVRVKETEADLHEKERIYRRIVEQATDLIYILDRDTRVMLATRQAVEIFSALVVKGEDGREIRVEEDSGSPQVAIGHKLDEFMGPGDVSFIQRQIDKVLETNHSVAYEHTVKMEGRSVRLSTKLIPIRDDEGHVHFLLGISRDMTERMEMDQRIYNAEKLASIGILASGVAHEINNPLAVILGFTDLLLERFPEDAPEHEDLKMIEENANHAKKVVENMLGFARITEGLEETVDVKQSTQTVYQIVRNTLMTKKVDVQMEIPEALPRVRGDTREFQQVIFNLINNAVSALNGEAGRLTLSAEVDGDWVHVHVTDTGVGIPNRIKPQIFDPFFTTKKVGEGTGLGLSLCYGIVKKYGGKISFTSSSADDFPDQPTGTTFVVSMPVHRGEDL
jgi:two-component system NtrC family sensor kinase